MKASRIFWNAGTTSAQVLVNALLLFVLYRYLVKALGIHDVGIWSLMLSGTTFATLTTQGFANGIVVFVAKSYARHGLMRVSEIVQTALLFSIATLGVAVAAAYPLAIWILSVLLRSADRGAARAILPWVSLSLCATVLAMILQAALTGLQKIDLCNYVESAGALGYVGLAVALVPGQGLRGLAYAQTIQSGLSLLALWGILKKVLIQLPAVPHRWNAELLGDLRRYGLQFQAVTLAQAVREPVTKALLARFGGPSLTGYYDLAARWVVNVRELLVQANQVLIPQIADLWERQTEAVSAVYRDSYRLLFYLSLPLFTLLFLLSPIASEFWLGRVDRLFITFVALLAGGWLINVLCNPAYVVALGTGGLRGVSLGCLATAAFNPILGCIVGRYWGGAYVVATSAFSLAAGYGIVLVWCHRTQHISFRLLLPDSSVSLLVAAASVAGLFLVTFYLHPSFVATQWQCVQWSSLSIVVSLVAMGLIMWRHPLRKRLMKKIS